MPEMLRSVKTGIQQRSSATALDVPTATYAGSRHLHRRITSRTGAAQALRLGADAFVVKQLAPSDLISAIQSALTARRMSRLDQE